VKERPKRIGRTPFHVLGNGSKVKLNNFSCMGLASVLTALVVALAAVMLCHPRTVLLDTPKLLVAFTESAKVQKELRGIDDEWKAKLKTPQDSLQISMDQVTCEYDRAPAARKRELQDQLAARNQQINNFRAANERQMEKLRAEKMNPVVDKVNV
jgi:hypothetical protein